MLLVTISLGLEEALSFKSIVFVCRVVTKALERLDVLR